MVREDRLQCCSFPEKFPTLEKRPDVLAIVCGPCLRPNLWLRTESV